MPRANARNVLQNNNASNREIERAILLLIADLDYLVASYKTNPAQETQTDIRESRELLDKLRAKLATLE